MLFDGKVKKLRINELVSKSFPGKKHVRIQRGVGGGEVVRIPDILTKQLTFFSLTILQRGPISRKRILFKVLEEGVNFIQGIFNFFLEGVGPVCFIQWKPVELVLCCHGSKMQ